MRIDDMSIEQLLELNKIICDRIDELYARKDLAVLAKLRLGQEVRFDSQHERIFGIVIKINRKTVVVQAEDGRQWKLPAGKLNLLKDAQ